MSELSLKPGVSLGGYPQQRDRQESDLEARLRLWLDRRLIRLRRRRYSQAVIARRVRQYDKALGECNEADLDILLTELRARLRRQGLREPLIIEAFAVIREIAARTLGKRHFDTQLYGGWLMVNGMLAEIQTGEGKTRPVPRHSPASRYT